jgi:hypothetical protein
MRAALFGVGVLSAALSSPAAASASATNIFQKHGLFGTWAVDCARPPNITNPHVIYRLIEGNLVQRQTSVAAGEILDLSTIDTAAEASPTELVISWRTDKGGITNRILLGDGWMQVLDSTRSNGEKLVVKGRQVSEGTEAPRFARCSPGQSA